MKLIRGIGNILLFIGNILLVTVVLTYVSILLIGTLLTWYEYLTHFWNWIN